MRQSSVFKNFSYVTGIPLGEYIRCRRLSLAALSLREGEKVVDVALRYGYASPEAFARAFRALHGISPRQAAAREVRLRMCPRLRFVLQVKEVCEMEYRIVELGGNPWRRRCPKLWKVECEQRGKNLDRAGGRGLEILGSFSRSGRQSHNPGQV